MKRLLSVVIISALASPSYAGMWGDLVGAVTGTTTTPAVAEPTATATASPSMTAQAMQLLPMLTSSLGVTDQQASGGVGSLLQLAQANLGDADFGTLATAIPGAQNFLSAAPTVAADTGVGSILSAAGNLGSSINTATQVYSQFKTLGLDPAMIPKYIEVVTQFLQSTGSTDAMGLFSQAMGSLQG